MKNRTIVFVLIGLFGWPIQGWSQNCADGYHVRVHNTSERHYHEVIVRISGDRVSYGGLRPGHTSDYLTVEGYAAIRSGAFEVYIQDGFGSTQIFSGFPFEYEFVPPLNPGCYEWQLELVRFDLPRVRDGGLIYGSVKYELVAVESVQRPAVFGPG